MTRSDFLKSIENALVKQDVVDKIEEVYGNIVPEEIKKILSLYSVPELFDENESRTLSINEVLHAEEDNGIPFKSIKTVPIIDCGDNDYIVYDYTKETWCMYNILDETMFNEEKRFEDLFLK